MLASPELWTCQVLVVECMRVYKDLKGLRHDGIKSNLTTGKRLCFWAAAEARENRVHTYKHTISDDREHEINKHYSMVYNY